MSSVDKSFHPIMNGYFMARRGSAWNDEGRYCNNHCQDARNRAGLLPLTILPRASAGTSMWLADAAELPNRDR